MKLFFVLLLALTTSFTAISQDSLKFTGINIIYKLGNASSSCSYQNVTYTRNFGDNYTVACSGVNLWTGNLPEIRFEFVRTVDDKLRTLDLEVGKYDRNGLGVSPVQRTISGTTSTTITTGGTAQTAIAANANRTYLSIQNTGTSDLFFAVGSVASLTNGYRLAAGSSYEPRVLPTGFISLFGATTGQTFTFIQQ